MSIYSCNVLYFRIVPNLTLQPSWEHVLEVVLRYSFKKILIALYLNYILENSLNKIHMLIGKKLTCVSIRHAITLQAQGFYCVIDDEGAA